MLKGNSPAQASVKMNESGSELTSLYNSDLLCRVVVKAKDIN